VQLAWSYPLKLQGLHFGSMSDGKCQVRNDGQVEFRTHEKGRRRSPGTRGGTLTAQPGRSCHEISPVRLSADFGCESHRLTQCRLEVPDSIGTRSFVTLALL